MNYSDNIKIIVLLSFLFGISYTFAQEVKKIEIVHADMIDYDRQLLGDEIKRLTGNVIFKHDNAVMSCDSAYFNNIKNIMHAFGRIHINQGDTLHLYGDSLTYDGTSKIAYVRYNVKLTHDKAVLTTDSLNYYRLENYAYYFDYGKIVDNENVLESKYGYYYTIPKDYVAVDSVTLVNPDYTMYSDTLKYNINTEISTFLGPTTIISDSNLIYCENGWYNTKTNISQYNKNAYITNKEQTLKGDSLYYDRNRGIGKAFRNVQLTDTVENVILLGHYGIYYEKQERAMFTDSTIFIQISDGDSMYLHADTLRYKTLTDTITKYYRIQGNASIDDTNMIVVDTVYFTPDSVEINPDTLVRISEYKAVKTDSVYIAGNYVLKTDTFILATDSLELKKDTMVKSKLMWAYYRVKVFKQDIQSKCDSLAYVMRDSVIQMFYQPVIWSGENQITAGYIELHTANDKPDYIVMQKASFIISREDSSRFNQIKGKNMIGYFRNDSIYRVDVDGNGQSLYYPKERDKKDNKEKLIGVNKAEASKLVIYLKENKPDKIMFISTPAGTLNPVEYLPESELKYKGFVWLENQKPLKKEDIFIWNSNSKYYEISAQDALQNITETETVKEKQQPDKNNQNTNSGFKEK